MSDDPMKSLEAGSRVRSVPGTADVRDAMHEAVERMLVALLDEAPHANQWDALHRLRRAERDLAALAS
jgi:hypothetical protein